MNPSEKQSKFKSDMLKLVASTKIEGASMGVDLLFLLLKEKFGGQDSLSITFEGLRDIKEIALKKLIQVKERQGVNNV